MSDIPEYTFTITGITREEARNMIDSEFAGVLWDRMAGQETCYPARNIIATLKPKQQRTGDYIILNNKGRDDV